MIQWKSHHAESCAKTRKSSAAQNRIQGKTTNAPPVPLNAPGPSLSLIRTRGSATSSVSLMNKRQSDHAFPPQKPPP